jgi:hypothetical protein
MVLNMAQTWHQLRPGEIRHDCGGCHAHSQQPTRFEDTCAARPDYKLWDLTEHTPLVTAKQSGTGVSPVAHRRDAGATDSTDFSTQWDAEDSTGLRRVKGVVNVEYHRDIRPILERSCVACHTKEWGQPAGNLVLDADGELVQVENKGRFPGTYMRLAADNRAQFGHKPVGWDSWGYPQASRYVRMLQSRRSLLVWKVFGRRLDGFTNDDHPSESRPGSGDLVQRGEPVDVNRFKARCDIDFVGSPMPPPEAVAGTYVGPDGQKIKVEPLGDEDRRTLVRWIDLGCPIDLDYDPARPEERGYGWMCDDNRPVLTLASPQAGANPPLARVLIGMHDYYTGLDPQSFRVTADFELAGVPAGENLAGKFASRGPGVWELKLPQPLSLERGKLVVSIQDRQGNTSRIERTFSSSSAGADR